MSESRTEQALIRFRDVVDQPYDMLRQWKQTTGKKVVGCSPMHFPEELVHAAGMLPVVLQETDEAVTEGFSHVHPFYCGITRNIIDLAARNKLEIFDSLIFSDICIQNRNAALTLKYILPNKDALDFVQFPSDTTRGDAHEEGLREMNKLRSRLEELAGEQISEASLANSIQVFNENRGLLKRFRSLCIESPGLLPQRDRQAVVQAAMLMPKEEHNELLAGMLEELETKKPEPPSGKPLFLSGHLCQSPKTDILDLIEGAGGYIVGDDLFTGYRYYALDVNTNGNPMEALVSRCLDRTVPMPTRSDGELTWDRWLLEKVRETGAEGVVILIAKYCEPHLFFYPFIKKSLTAAGIPHLMLETEHEVVSLEGMRTRLQAFIEMLG